MVTAEVLTSDAEVVMAQLIVSLGGFALGSSLALAWRHWRSRHADWPLTTMLLLSFAGVVALTTDHVYRHLLADDAPLWQLWGALTAFSLGAWANMAAFVKVGRGTRKKVPPPDITDQTAP
jgi:hypothetical protein